MVLLIQYALDVPEHVLFDRTSHVKVVLNDSFIYALVTIVLYDTFRWVTSKFNALDMLHCSLQ